MNIRKVFQPCHNLIIVSVTVIVSSNLTHLLKRINDNQLCICVFRHKSRKLFIQPFPKLASGNRKVKVFCALCPEHPIQAFLQASVIIFKGKIQHRSFPGGVIPKRCACTDVIGKLCHQKTLSQFGRTCKNISAGVEQAVDQRRLVLVLGVKQFTH